MSTPDKLFTDAELEPVEVVQRHRGDLESYGNRWAARCANCQAWLSHMDTADEARRSGLAALDGHRCAMPGELPDSF